MENIYLKSTIVSQFGILIQISMIDIITNKKFPQNMMVRPRLSAVLTISFIVSGFAVYNAFRKHKQFYPSMVHISKSSFTLAVLYFQVCALAVGIVSVAKSMFFGNLRSIEIEHLMDRTWYAVTETCLAFTVFRDDFSPHFIGMFIILIIVKCAHWLAEDRIEYAEQTPGLQSRFHIQMKSLLCVLLFIDTCLPLLSFRSTIQHGPSVQIVFGFEYAVLLISALSTAMKYCLYEIDRHSDHQWEDKGTFLLYADLVCGFFRVLVYSCFVVIMVKIYTVPLFIIRPMYLSLRALKKSINDVVQARRAILNLNSMYPDASEEDLNRNSDRTCIICRDEMQVNQICKKLPCNHIFHRSCLRSWFQRQQTCPTCRTDILSRPDRQPGNVLPQQQQIPNVERLSAAAAPGINNARPNLQQPSSVEINAPPNQNGRQLPNIILPPFAFPPPPLPNVTLLPTDSIEHLKMEECKEQERIIARIETLRNVRLLLDASFIQLNHYLNMQPDSSDFTHRLKECSDNKKSNGELLDD
ncbi:hypothetical protein GJ496_011865 [Pomphorhynchus laevis]|nr:hypothetical protein GJ496_011865 [Pomphorhynchus laevis]